jgi:hypothetical protein
VQFTVREFITRSAKQLGVTAKVEYLSDFACVLATATNQPLVIEDKSCARKLGL